MKAYHGQQEIKNKFIKRVQAHRAADELVKGGVEGRQDDGTFRGCAVTCTMDKYSHAAYETEIGVPRMLARLEDGIFENLPNDRAMSWPEEFLTAIPVGADLSLVGAKFLHWLLVDPKDGVIRHATSDESKKAIQHVGDLYAKKIAGEEVTIEQWRAARTGAWNYYWRYAAADAADAAADAADAAAADAAADAAAARRWTTLWDKEYKNSRVKQADKLLELMAAAPVISDEPPLQRAA